MMKFRHSKGLIALICTVLCAGLLMTPVIFADGAASVSTQTTGLTGGFGFSARRLSESGNLPSLPAPALPGVAKDPAVAEIPDRQAVEEALAQNASDAASTDRSEPTVIGVSTDGDGNEILYYSEEMPRFASIAPSEQATLEEYVDVDELWDYIHTQLLNFPKSIDLTQYHIPLEAAGAVLNLVWYSMPDCFHVQRRLSYGISGNQMLSLLPQYFDRYSSPDGIEQYKADLAACESAADRLLSGIEGNAELTDAEKALLVHDRLALWCEYDYQRLLDDNLPDQSYCINGILIDGTGVCQGYALTYGYLLDRIGIENCFVSSPNNNHAWNIVTIDGKRYHVDVTWDDPVWDVTGRVGHDNFLRSSDGIIATGHKPGDFDTTPNDTTYDDAYWQCSNSAFLYLRGGLYYLDEDTFTLWRRDGDTSTKVTDLSTKWPTGQPGYYYTVSPRLDSDGANLLVSQPDGIYSCDVLTGVLTPIWKPQLDSGYWVYGFTYKEDQLICVSNNQLDFDASTKKNREQTKSYTVRVPGDADGDGTVAPMDVDLLLSYLQGRDTDLNRDVCDVDGDGKISMRDLALLRQFLNGLPVYLQ